MESETPPTASSSSLGEARDQPSSETPAFVSLRLRAAEMLRIRAPELAERWEARARSVALRDASEPVASGHVTAAVALIESLSSVLASDGAISEDMVARGLAFGAEAFESGSSLHHTLKALNLLSAMTMYMVETVAGEKVEGDLAPVDGVRLSRRFQQGLSLLMLSVVKGFTHASEDGMRERFRSLRHDLRNPLGTIRSVLALMDDETISPEERSNPRFHAMAKRNARSMGDLIGERLSDAEAVPRAHAFQLVSLRTIACAVRRELRAEATVRKTTVLVAGSKTRLQVDAIGLELMLHELLLVALHESVAGDELNITFGEAAGGRVTVRLRRIPPRSVISDGAGLERLTVLAKQMNAKLDVSDHLVLSIVAHAAEAVVSPAEVGASVPVSVSADAPVRSADADARYDGRSPRQREHGQPGTL